MEEQKASKVTLYLPPDLHRQLKIRSAVEGEAMSAIAKRAIDFYLAHSDVVEGLEASYGQTHRIHNCPSCSAAVVLREGDLVEVQPVSMGSRGGAVGVDLDEVVADSHQPDEGELVVC